MHQTLASALYRFRITAISEGISFLILLGIAMPIKYLAHQPLPVKIIGWIHGLLFMLYLITLLHAAIVYRWSILKVIAAFIASLVPFGTFVLDKRLKAESDTQV